MIRQKDAGRMDIRLNDLVENLHRFKRLEKQHFFTNLINGIDSVWQIGLH